MEIFSRASESTPSFNADRAVGLNLHRAVGLERKLAAAIGVHRSTTNIAAVDAFLGRHQRAQHIPRRHFDALDPVVVIDGQRTVAGLTYGRVGAESLDPVDARVCAVDGGNPLGNRAIDIGGVSSPARHVSHRESAYCLVDRAIDKYTAFADEA